MPFTHPRRGAALGSFVLFFAALLCLGGGLFLLFFSSDAEASLPATPLGEIKGHAGDKKLVRVQARLVSDPPAISPKGAELALQRVQVIEAGNKIIYDETAPGALWANDGKNIIAVDSGDFDTDLVYIAASETIAKKGELPAVASALLLPDFNDVPTPVGAMVRVMNIEQGAPVTIIGVVKTQNGAPILIAPDSDASYVLSPLSEKEFASAMNNLSPMGRALAWSLMALGVLLIGATIKNRRRVVCVP